MEAANTHKVVIDFISSSAAEIRDYVKETFPTHSRFLTIDMHSWFRMRLIINTDESRTQYSNCVFGKFDLLFT